MQASGSPRERAAQPPGERRGSQRLTLAYLVCRRGSVCTIRSKVLRAGDNHVVSGFPLALVAILFGSALALGNEPRPGDGDHAALPKGVRFRFASLHFQQHGEVGRPFSAHESAPWSKESYSRTSSMRRIASHALTPSPRVL